MKRILAWVLLLVMVLGMFAGCKNTEDPTPTTDPATTAPQGSGIQGPGAQDAIDYLKSLYQDDGTETPVDYNRYGIVRVGGIEFKIEWSVDVAEDLVKIVVNEDGTVTVDINEQCEEATPYVLTATITDENGNVATYSWNHILPKAQDMVEIVKAAYALAVGESLPYESRLIGKIISIDSIWSDEYQNITVTIEITGAEDMPIKCYRMKGNDNTITVIKDLKVGNIITVLGTLKNYEGTIEFDAGCILEKVEKGDAIDAPTDPGEILKAAYALAKDEALPYQATLTGTVTEIDNPYDPNYGNISVVIEVEGYPQYPILCYRLKGTGVDQIAVDDLITVTGIIKNYNGTIEYDAGCIMTERVSGGGTVQGPSSDAAKILADAAKLSSGEKLPYRATLTGEIVSVDNAYDPNYGNVTVTIKVNGVKIQCYRMVGDGIDQIRETDTITVSGVIENYNGKLEFGAKSTLDSWTPGPRNVNYGSVKEDVAYRLYMDQKATGNTVYFNGEVSSNRLQTTTTGSKGVDVYAERHSKGLRFYYMDGNTKTYIEIEEYTNDNGQQRGGLRVTTEPSCYWVYNSDCGVYIVNLPTAGKYFLGTYGTYETISASWIGYIDGSYSGGSTQYVAKFIEASKVQDEEPSDTIVQGTAVEDPAVGTAYKFGYYQNQVDGKPFLAFSGKMAGWYYGTADAIANMVDVYLEEAEGGYHIYFMDGNAKTYLDVVPRDTDATKVNTVLQTSGAHTVWQLNLEHKYVYTTAVGSEWYLGTFGTNNTISASLTSYISDTSLIGVSQFCAWFSEVEEVEAPDPEPTDPQPTVPGGSTLTIEEAIAMGSAMAHDTYTSDKYYVTGVITEVYNTQYGNMRITDGAGNILTIYGTYSADGSDRYDAMSVKPVVGDTVKIYGVVGQYNGTAQIKNGWIVEHTPSGEEPEPTDPQPTVPGGSTLTIAEAIAMGSAMDHNVYTSDKYYVTGVITEVYSTQYGNMRLTDDAGNILTIYGTYSADGSDRYDAMSVKPVVGDTVTIYGVVGQYNGTPQIKNGWIVAHTPSGEEPEPTNPQPSEPTEPIVPGDGYNKITSADQFTSGKYVMIVSTGYAPGVFDNGWLSAVQPVVSGNTVTDPAGGVWTLTVNGSSVTITDANGVTVKPKGGANNGISEGTYEWAWSFENGTFEFAGVGSDTVLLASNTSTDAKYGGFNRFRGYKTTTISGAPSSYPCQFTLYKLGGEIGEEPEVTDPQPTDPQPTVPGGSTLTIAEAITMGSAMDHNVYTSDKYYVTGVITEVYSTQYGNMRLTDDAGNILTIYGTYSADGSDRYDAMSVKPVAGDTVTIYGVVGQYNGTPQIKNGWIVAHTPSGEEPEPTDPQPTVPGGSTLTIAEAIAMGSAMDHNVYTSDKYYVTGVITEVYSTQYGNMRLTDDAGNILTIYGTYSADGSDRYDAMSVKPVAGDTVTIYGVVGQYNGTPQIKNGWIVAHTPSGEEPEPTNPQPTEPAGSVDAVDPEIGNAYKFGMIQENVGINVYYITGVKDGYYMATTTDVEAASDVYLEAADGGYYLYTLVGGAKKYINMVVSGTHVNGEFENAASTVYTYDAEKQTIVATVDDALYWFGTRNDNTYTTIGPVKVEYNGFYAKFYGASEGGNEPEVTEPEESEPEESTPSAGSTATYTFSNYTGAAQYEDVTRQLDDVVSVSVTQCHFTTQLRIYQDAKYDGKAFFTCTKAFQSLVINAGHKDATLNVLGSNDGVNYTLIQAVATTSSYGDYVIELPAGTTYKYLMLDAVDAQIRVKYITFNFAE